MKPLVSIIIPSYNKAELTVRTVESVLAQTYPNIEIVVVDDGSSDDTVECLQIFNSIRVIQKPNGGACSARNRGLEEIKGEYVGFLDCDDTYEPEKVEKSVAYLQSHPDFGFVHTAAYFTDEYHHIVQQYSHPRSQIQGKIAQRLIMGNFICNSTIIARRKCFGVVGGFDESIFPPADWDMWLRLAENFSVGYVDEPLTRYRVTDNYTFNKLELSRKEEEYVLAKFFDRNPKASAWIHRQARSCFYLRYAQCYILQEDAEKLNSALRDALRSNPLNLKAYVLAGVYTCARGWLMRKLQQRILRTV